MKKSSKSLSKIHNFLKVIADKNRLMILKYLTGGKRCVCEIWESIGLPQNLTSHHLKILKDFNLISSKKVGLKVIYSLNRDVLEKYLKSLISFYIKGE